MFDFGIVNYTNHKYRWVPHLKPTFAQPPRGRWVFGGATSQAQRRNWSPKTVRRRRRNYGKAIACLGLGAPKIVLSCPFFSDLEFGLYHVVSTCIYNYIYTTIGVMWRR